jgi:hypothetical protein
MSAFVAELLAKAGVQRAAPPSDQGTGQLPDIAAYASATDVGGLLFPATVVKGTYATRYGSSEAVTPLSVSTGLTANQLCDLLAPGQAPALITEGLKGMKGTAVDRAKLTGAMYALPFALPEGVARSADTVQAGHWLGIDLDGVTQSTVGQAIATLKAAGLWHLAFSTFSDGLKETEKGRRVRLVLLLDRPANKTEFKAAYMAACGLLQIQADASAGKPEQLCGCWCAPAPQVLKAAGIQAPVFEAFKRYSPGAALSVDKLLGFNTVVSGPVPGAHAGAIQSIFPASLALNDDLSAGLHPPTTLERLSEALEWVDPGAAYDFWVTAGQSLAACAGVLGDDQVRALWVEWCDRAPDDRKAKNGGADNPLIKWATFNPSMSSDAGAGWLCSQAKDGALYAARSAMGAACWPDKAGRAVAYLQKHHPATMVEFSDGDYPTLPDIAGSGTVKPQQVGAVGLLALAADLGRVVLDQFGAPTVVGPFGPSGRTEALSHRDQRFSDALLLAAMDAGAKVPGKEAITNTCSVLAAQARRAGESISVQRRLASLPGGAGIAVDLGDEQGRAVVVSASGIEIQAQERHGLYFRRGDGYSALPEPINTDTTPQGVAAAMGLLTGWLRGLGVPERESPLVVALLVRWMIPTGTFPILELVGPAGQGKSTKTDLLASLLDPQPGGRAISPVKLDIATIAAACSSACVVALDNLSWVKPDESDMLCRLTTGFKASMKELYTTSDSKHVEAHARVIVNGITPVLTRGDALDRAIRVALEASPGGFKAVEQVHAEFETQHPALFGALCVLLHASLKQWGNVGNANHRLVEFVTVGRALALATGQAPAVFDTVFDEHRREIATYMSDGDPVARCLVPALAKMAAQAVRGEQLQPWGSWFASPGWSAIARADGSIKIAVTAGALVKQLHAHMPNDVAQSHRAREAVPENPRAVAGAVARITPMLRNLGLTATREELAARRIVFTFTGVLPNA